MGAADLHVEVKDRILSITGKRYVSNSQTQKFARQFQLDTAIVDLSTTKANLVDGVLTITVEKTRKDDNLMKITITTNPTTINAVAVAEEEEEEKKEDMDNEVVMVETTNDAE